MKRITALAAFALLLWAVPSQAQGNPDCQYTDSFTAATAGPAHDNRGTPCAAWRLTYSTAATMTGLSIQIEGAQLSTGPWSAIPQGSIVQGTNPLTDPGSGTLTVEGTIYYPWIRIDVTVFTPTGPTGTITARTYGYKGTNASVGTTQPNVIPCVGTPGDTIGLYRQQCQTTAGQIWVCNNPLGCALAADWVGNPMTTLGDMIFENGTPAPDRVPGNTTSQPQCLIQTGDGTNSAAPVWSACPSAGTLTYYFQNSILASGSYTSASGGSITGSAADTCTLSAFDGGGSGATATVALTGNNVIAGGTSIVVTAPGSQYTAIPTSATLGNGTATCSGTATLVTVLNVPPSDKTGDFPAITPPYAPRTNMVYTQVTGSAGTQDLQDWITPIGVPHMTFIPAGEYSCHLHALRSNAFTGTVNLQCEFVEVDASGADLHVIGVSEPTPNITLVETEYTLVFADGDVYTMTSAASRIVCRVQSVHTNISVAGTITLATGGEADQHVSLPSNTVDSSTFVPYTGATADLDIGDHGYIGGASTTPSFRFYPDSIGTPAAPVVTQGGTGGSTAYAYQVAWLTQVGWGPLSAATSTMGNATLSGSNYNIVTPASCPTNATGFAVVRSADPHNNTGLLPVLGACGGSVHDIYPTGGTYEGQLIPWFGPPTDTSAGTYAKFLRSPYGMFGDDPYSFTWVAQPNSAPVQTWDHVYGAGGSFLSENVNKAGGLFGSTGMFATAIGVGTSTAYSGNFTAIHAGGDDTADGILGVYAVLSVADSGNVLGPSAAYTAVADSYGGGGRFTDLYFFDCGGGFGTTGTGQNTCLHSTQPPVPGSTLYFLKEEGGLPSELSGTLKTGTFTLAQLVTLGPAAGTQAYCSDCKVTSALDNTCAGSGTGAVAFEVATTLKCFQ